MNQSTYFILLIILNIFTVKVISLCEENYLTYKCESLYSPSILKINNNRLNEINIRNSLISELSLKMFQNNYKYAIKSINKLYVVNCSTSKLVDDGLTDVPLKVFDLTNNALVGIDAIYFNRFKNLMSLNVSNNYISSLDINTFHKLDNLLYLNVSGNKLNELSQKWEGLNALQILDLSRNNIYVIVTNFFSGMIKLKKLHLEYNNIVKLDYGLFNSLSSLNYLNLSRNNITIFNMKTFGYGLTNLTELDISYNKIMTIDAILFHNIHNLKKLYLAFNQLTKLELEGILDATELSVIDFDGNLMSCQVISAMLKTLKKYNVRVIKGSTVHNISIYGIKCFETYTNQDKQILKSNSTEYPNFNGIYFESILSKFSEKFTGNLENLLNNVTAIMELNGDYLKNGTDINMEHISSILESVQKTFEEFITKLEFQNGEGGSKKNAPTGHTELTIFSNNLTTLLNKYNNDLTNIKFDHEETNNNMNKLFDKLQQVVQKFMSRPETVRLDNFVDDTKTAQNNNLSNILYGLITVAVLILISCIIIIALFSMFFINKKNTFHKNEFQEMI